MFKSDKQCPRCDSKDINVVKPSFGSKVMESTKKLALGPFMFLRKDKKNLNVCRKCGFSWEDR